jgi:hypothetical protein
MGHVRNYTMGDVVARYRRAKGLNVLHPMGWDAFGLPAENAAMEKKIHPATWTFDNIATMRTQLKSMGLSLDWSREIATCHPEYYRHEQAMFLDMLEAGLVYRKEASVNWDPVDQTVLANEQVIDGRGWRTGAVVERRKLAQWFFRITAYAEELRRALDGLDRWPAKVRLMQENWIGRSEGARAFFKLTGSKSVEGADTVEIFTTRPDTLFGATFFVMAPEHPDIERLAAGTEHEHEVRRYQVPGLDHRRNRVHDALERLDASGLTGEPKVWVERALQSPLLQRAGFLQADQHAGVELLPDARHRGEYGGRDFAHLLRHRVRVLHEVQHRAGIEGMVFAADALGDVAQRQEAHALVRIELGERLLVAAQRVDDVVVRDHRALRVAGRPAREDDLEQVVRSDRGGRQRLRAPSVIGQGFDPDDRQPE